MEAPPTVAQLRKGAVSEKYRDVADSDFKRKFINSITGSIEAIIKDRLSIQSQTLFERDEKLDQVLKERLSEKKKDRQYLKMLEIRKKLPAHDKREELLSTLRDHQVILVSGETGCGKTTQVPQFILDEEIEAGRGSQCHIVCTQPRRISAISIAERIAQERAERLGESVGYHIRLERVLPRDKGSLVLCTTGILLQVLETDPVLSRISHVVLDEIHERDTLSDFTITILKHLVSMRKDLKVILMSATLNADQFSKYYDGCPTVHIPGFTFPVKELYLEDVLTITGVVYDDSKRRPQHHKGRRNNFTKKDKEEMEYRRNFLEPYIRSMRSKRKYSGEILEYIESETADDINMTLIVKLLEHIGSCEPPGAVLVFLPGWDRISKLVTALQDSGHFPSSKYVVVPLHSMMPTVTQKSVFDRPPPGKRKIVIATNIAETSITIDDIVYVVNCGKIKMKNFDIENKVTTLKEEWVSLANSRQRRGRAGRVQEGVCYHLYCRPRELTLESFQLPEMLRTRLEEVILQIKVLQLGLAGPFLARVMDPPSDIALTISIDLLKDMKALDEEEHLTPLGYHLAQLPVDPQAGKMILLASLFSCIDPITSIASSLSFKDPFYMPLGKEKEVDAIKRRLSEGSKSDHILMANVMEKWRNASHPWSFASNNFLAHSTLSLLKDMKQQFVDHLHGMKFLNSRKVDSPESNINSRNHALLRSVICGGLYPNVAVIKRRRKSGFSVYSASDGKVSIHIKSVNCNESDLEGGFLAYYLKIHSTSTQLHDTSMIFPMSLVFFSQGFTVEDNPDRRLSGYPKLIRLSNNMCLVCQTQVASIIQELRAWLDWLLEYKIAHPGVIDWKSSSDETSILRAIVILLTAESKFYLQDSDYSDDDEDPRY